MRKDKKIHVVLGFHVNYNHSYRGDRNDDSGFGYDSVVIRGIIDTLDRANAKGLDARGTWDFDHFWSVQNCMAKHAPDILEDLARRISSGRDESILDNWNNGIMSAMTREELRISIERTITNEWGSGLKDRFKAYSPVVRSQETMFTHGNIETLAGCGVKAVALYYSAIPFDSIRNFVPKLSPNERYNPLRLKCPVSGLETLIIPMYNQGDVFDKLSLEMWLRKIRKQQLSGEIPGNALLYINMDADAKMWNGMGLPAFLNWVPNAAGLEEFIKVVNKLDYAQFGTLGDYIENNPSVGEIHVDMDTADGSHTGYSSWSEKWINYVLWTLHQRGRRSERIAAALLEKGLVAGEEAREIRDMLYGPGLSNLECRVLTASTTHFGLAAPMVNPERLRVAFYYADTANRKAESAVNSLIGKLAPSGAGSKECVKITMAGFNKYKGGTPPLADSLQAAGVELPPSFSTVPLSLAMKDETGTEIPFDIIPDRQAGAAVVFAPGQSTEAVRTFSIEKRGGDAAAGSVIVADDLLSNGLVTIRLDKDGAINSLMCRGVEFAAGPLFNPGVTYSVGGKNKWFGPKTFRARSVAGARGRYGSLELSYEFRIGGSGSAHRVTGVYHLSVFEGLPYVYVNGWMKLPQTECTKSDVGISTRIFTQFDPDWKEVIPLGIRPGFNNLPGKHLKVWKHNFLDVTHAYDLKFGEYDPRNKNIDSLNNHITDGWVAFSNGERGLMFAHDQSLSTTFAMCPIRLRESKGIQKLQINPFGAYSGSQLSHMPDGSGVSRELMIAAVPSIETTAPSFNGRRISFSVMLAPYFGDEPPAEMQRDAAVFSMPTALYLESEGGLAPAKRPQDSLSVIQYDYVKEHSLENTGGWQYSDFIDDANSRPAAVPEPEKGHGENLPKLPPELLARAAIDLAKATLKIF